MSLCRYIYYSLFIHSDLLKCETLSDLKTIELNLNKSINLCYITNKYTRLYPDRNKILYNNIYMTKIYINNFLCKKNTIFYKHFYIYYIKLKEQ